ncbi:MAG: hypothetical protein WKF43_05635 [Acidimicrobiales bacterium]
MTAGRFLLGVLLAVVVLVPLALGSRQLRRRLLPSWTGPEAGLVDVVLGLSVAVLMSEALGTVGLFRTVPIVIALGAAGATMWLVLRAGARPAAAVVVDGPIPEATNPRPATMAVAALALAAVAGSWIARTIRSIDRGMTTVDTFWYHLPVAARFVQTGSLTAVQYLDDEPVTAYFPANSSLLHAIGFLLFGSDLVSTVVNIGWLALAVAAAWCAGRPFGIAPAAAVGTALVLGTPGMVATQPGGAYNDVAGLALLLTAAAIALHGRALSRPVAQDLVAALAAGLAIGMKFTFVLPAGALCLGLAVTTPRGARVRRSAVVVLGAILTGGYWYARNARATGNPLPSLDVSFGPLSLPSATGATPTSTVANFLFDGRAWTENFLPGLRSSFGPGWIAVVALALAGLVAALAQRDDARVRMLGIVGLLAAAGYVATPQYLIGGFGRPFFFGVNLRYVSPALVLGLILLPIVLRRWGTWVLGAYTLAVIVTQVDPTSWPTGFRWATLSDRASGAYAAGAVAVLLLGAAVAGAGVTLWRHSPQIRSNAIVAGVAIPVAVLLVLAGFHGAYLDDRYVDHPPFPDIYAWVRDVHDSRIALFGLYMQGQYPFAGADFSNHAQYAGVRTDGGGFRPARTCAEWVQLLESGRYDYAVIGPTKGASEWTAAQPDAALVLRMPLGDGSVGVEVFRLDRDLSPRSC